MLAQPGRAGAMNRGRSFEPRCVARLTEPSGGGVFGLDQDLAGDDLRMIDDPFRVRPGEQGTP